MCVCVRVCVCVCVCACVCVRADCRVRHATESAARCQLDVPRDDTAVRLHATTKLLTWLTSCTHHPARSVFQRFLDSTCTEIATDRNVSRQKQLGFYAEGQRLVLKCYIVYVVHVTKFSRREVSFLA